MNLKYFLNKDYTILAPTDIKLEIAKLADYLNEQSYLYHTKDSPIIADIDYDKLFQLLQGLVEANLQFKPANSVLDRVVPLIILKSAICSLMGAETLFLIAKPIIMPYHSTSIGSIDDLNLMIFR